MSIKAIETRYNGCRFRSRLEARWAVFFDSLGVKWSYEPQGFVINGQPYLPDFFLTDWQTWLEVKPTAPPEHGTIRLCTGLRRETKQSVLVVCGNPWVGEHRIYDTHGTNYYQSFHEGGYAYPGLREESNGEWHCNIYYTQFAECRRCDGLCLLANDDSVSGWMEVGPHTCGDHDKWPVGDSIRIVNAYTAARSARFEFGESG